MYSSENGLAYTASSDASISFFDNALNAYLGSRADTPDAIAALLHADPEMPMALCFRGYLLKLAGHPRFRSGIDTCITRLRLLHTKNERESLHVEALHAWVTNDLNKAKDLFEAILRDYPTDVLAIRLVHYLHFYAGDAVGMRDSIARVLPHWREADTFYGFLIGAYAFALEESGQYQEAESYGMQAINHNQADIWAAHAVSHVFEMTGRYQDGVEWIETMTRQWDDINNFRFHLHWHRALFHLGLNDEASALAIYDDTLVPVVEDDFYLDLCNATSLLWRLELIGVDVGARWDGLLEISRNHIHDDELVFASLHYLMPLARLKDKAGCRAFIQHLKKWSQDDSTQASVVEEVGLPLAEALVEMSSGQRSKAKDLFKSVRHTTIKIGGSHTQRDLFDQLRHYSAG